MTAFESSDDVVIALWSHVTGEVIAVGDGWRPEQARAGRRERAGSLQEPHEPGELVDHDGAVHGEEEDRRGQRCPAAAQRPDAE
jgi:hypothetical protein